MGFATAYSTNRALLIVLTTSRTALPSGEGSSFNARRARSSNSFRDGVVSPVRDLA